MGWWVKFADNQGAVLFLWQAAPRAETDEPADVDILQRKTKGPGRREGMAPPGCF